MPEYTRASECRYCVHCETIRLEYDLHSEAGIEHTACLARSGNGYFCTRPRYHKGKHVACTLASAFHVLEYWK